MAFDIAFDSCNVIQMLFISGGVCVVYLPYSSKI